MEIPSVASPVGINNNIIQHGVNGYLANTSWEYEKYVQLLFQDTKLYNEIKKNTRKSVERKFSVKNNYPLLRSAINNVVC